MIRRKSLKSMPYEAKKIIHENIIRRMEIQMKSMHMARKKFYLCLGAKMVRLGAILCDFPHKLAMRK